jgi:protein dithiol oxidoreductase (disulfide-forming)
MRAALRTGLAALMLAAVAPFAAAQAPQGPGFEPVEPAQPTSAAPGKIEVIEVFSYGCHACEAFQPKMDAWLRKKPANVEFSYLPATFRPDFELFARAFYAAQALGVEEKTHHAIFKAAAALQKPVSSLDEIAAMYAANGVKTEDFLAAANSFAVNAKIKRVTQLLPRFGIDSTPTLIVAGKYRISGTMAGTYDNMITVLDTLVAQETAAATAAQ